MELSNLVKKFVLKKNNMNLVVDLTELSTNYISDFVLGRNYSNSLEKLRNYMKKLSDLKEVNPDEFSVELIKYFYEQRSRN